MVKSCEYRISGSLQPHNNQTYTQCRDYQFKPSSMSQTFALDLKVARRNSGLTQRDCAHLLDVHNTKISLLEQGKVLPSILEICTLSLLYGRSFESLFGSMMEDAHSVLRDRLATLPDVSNKWLGRFIRRNTLNKLAARLDNDPNDYGAS